MKAQKSANSKVDMIGEIVTQVVQPIQPVMVSVVTTAVTASTTQILTDFATKQTELRREFLCLKKRSTIPEISAGRTRTVRTTGLWPYPRTCRNEDCTNTQVINLAAAMGVTLKHEDISFSHRLPRRAGECKPMIVKFLRRDTKINKKKQAETTEQSKSTRSVRE